MNAFFQQLMQFLMLFQLLQQFGFGGGGTRPEPVKPDPPVPKPSARGHHLHNVFEVMNRIDQMGDKNGRVEKLEIERYQKMIFPVVRPDAGNYALTPEMQITQLLRNNFDDVATREMVGSTGSNLGFPIYTPNFIDTNIIRNVAAKDGFSNYLSQQDFNLYRPRI